MDAEGLGPNASWDVGVEGSISFCESHLDCKISPTTSLISPFGRLRNKSLADSVRNRFAELLPMRSELPGRVNEGFEAA